MLVSPSRKILIADDEPDCLDFVREALADSPYEVITAKDGKDALAKARAAHPDLYILDVQMPEKDGFGVFSELRADTGLGRAPVIMLTGVAEKSGIAFSADDMGQFLGSEPDAYLEKPIEPFLLKQTVDRLMRQTYA
jgi:two-component system alkaline phosphatase synthesis response regulator PhoP